MIARFLFVGFLLIISSCKKSEEQKRPQTLNISGRVTNKYSNTSVDSAALVLKHSSFFSFWHDTTIYSGSDGKFNLKFSPGEDKAYTLTADKTGFQSMFVSVSIDREYQDFNLQLDTL